MNKFKVAAVALSIAVLSFLAGGLHGNDNSAAGSDQDAPADTQIMNGQEDSGAPLSPGAVRIGPARRQLIGVKTAAAEQKPFTYTLRLYGKVVPDETRTFRVNASTDCWIRKISDVTTGSIVKKNQILAEALAPAYYNAQLTYLIALDNVDRIRQQLGGQLRHQQNDLANNQVRVAVQALQNLGITDAQTRELADTRQARPYLQVRSPADGVVLSRDITLNQWFKAAEEFYTIAEIGKVWVYADVYEDEAMHMRPGMAVRVRHARMDEAFDADVGEVLPLFDPEARTLKVRIDVQNPRYDLRPDMFVDVEIPITLPPALHVPADAILDAGTRSVVYVDNGNGAFAPRRVATGWRLDGQVEITRGLSPGEKIAVSGNFLLDSESRMELAALGGAGLSVDPVCGRYVDPEEAELLDMTATGNGETFYFHSEDCKKAFESEPAKYAPKKLADRASEDPPVRSVKDRTWADLLRPLKGGRTRKGSGAGTIKVAKDPPLSNYAITPEVVDWDGHKQGAPPPKWEKGWGGFPGAKYLGIPPDKGGKAGKSEKAAAAPPAAGHSAPEGVEDLYKELDELEKSMQSQQTQPAGQPKTSVQP